MGPGILPETTVSKHNPPLHLQMPTKAPSSKRKSYLNTVQKNRRVLRAKTHLKWTVSKWESVLWSDESKSDVLVGNQGRRVHQDKEERDRPSSGLKPASLMVWRCLSTYSMGNLHVQKGTMNAERSMKVLEQHLLPSRISAGQWKPDCSCYNIMASSETSPAAEPTWLQSRSFTYREHLEHH